MNLILKNKKGFLFPLVIIYTVIALIVGNGTLLLGSLERISSMKRLHREQAFYLAEAGINWARYQLKKNSSWVPNPNPTTVSLGTGTFQLSESVTGDTVIITSTGTVRGTTETTSMTVTKDCVFSKGIFCSGGVTLDNNALVDSYDSRLGPYGGSNVGSEGDVVSNTQIIVNNNAVVQGDATGGSVSDPMDGVTGTVTQNASNRTLPPVVIPSDLTSLTWPSSGINGNYTLSPDGTFTANGPVTISGGNFRFKNFTVGINAIVDITGTIRFYVENNFSLSNNSRVTLPGGELYIGTSGQIALANNSIFTNTSGTATAFGIYIASTNPQTFCNNSSTLAAAIYAPLATLKISNNAGFFGSVFANQLLTLAENAEMHYDVALRSNNPPGAPGGTDMITFVSWTKPDWKK